MVTASGSGRFGEGRAPGTARSQRGAALVYVLFLLVIATTAGMLLATSLAVDLRTRKEDARRVRLAPLLDSAVAEALADLAADPDAAGFMPHEFGGGWLESDITRLPDGRLEIVARATYAGMRRAVAADVVFGPYGPVVVAWRPGAPTRSP